MTSKLKRPLPNTVQPKSRLALKIVKVVDDKLGVLALQKQQKPSLCGDPSTTGLSHDRRKQVTSQGIIAYICIKV